MRFCLMEDVNFALKEKWRAFFFCIRVKTWLNVLTEICNRITITVALNIFTVNI